MFLNTTLFDETNALSIILDSFMVKSHWRFLYRGQGFFTLSIDLGSTSELWDPKLSTTIYSQLSLPFSFPGLWSSSILRPSLDKWRGSRRHHQTCLVDNQKCHVHESLTHCRRFCPGYSHMVVVTDGFTLVELPHRLDIVSWGTDVGSDSLFFHVGRTPLEAV